LKRCYGVAVIALSIVGDTEFVREILCGGIGFGDFVEGEERFVKFALFG
jgi:hypothetical protein